MSMKICIYVQHLLGSGHLYRMVHLANYLVQHNHHVKLVSGGRKIQSLPLDERVHFVQLLPISVLDETFAQYVGEEGQIVDEQYKAKRQKQLMAVCQSNVKPDIVPDIVIVEAFPFGRGYFSDELVPWLTNLKNNQNSQTKILCSVRDILNPKPISKAKVNKINQYIDRFFDYILVHGDPDFIPFEAAYNVSQEWQKKIVYTGYIHPQSRVPKNFIRPENLIKKNQIVVSVGQGVVGESLLQQAYLAFCESQKHPDLSSYTWLFLTGKQSFLPSTPHKNLVIQDKVPDLFQLFCQSKISISQLGYNTFCDVVFSGIEAIFVPFISDSEKEQWLRGQHLVQMNAKYHVWDKKKPSQEWLLALEACHFRDNKPQLNIDGNGMSRTLDFIEKLVSNNVMA